LNSKTGTHRSPWLGLKTISILASSWADVIHVRELAVGAAAINTLGNVGAFVMPYGWGVARDATGNFQVGLMALTAATAVLAALTLLLRSRVLKAQPLVVASA
jgi:ACS family tartrate transporter-like MFS transporter